jgi:hydroxymethylpyrimidine pyrophosphatase-like HAD family hydrolase
MPIRLICTDFDCTVFSQFDDPPVPVDLQRIIGDLQRQGIAWVINTGRDLPELVAALIDARLSITPDYVVVSERAIHVVQGGEYLPLEAWNRAGAVAHAALRDRVRGDMPRLLERISQHCVDQVCEDPNSPVSLIARNEEDAWAMQTWMREYGSTVPGLVVERGRLSARFTHGSYNKGTSLAQVGRRLGIEPGTIFAAGDHFNDLAMLSPVFARWLVAPANAVDPVKARVRMYGGYVSDQPCGSGVARGLEYFLGRRLTGLAHDIPMAADV